MIASVVWWSPATWPAPKMIPGVWTPLSSAPYLQLTLGLLLQLTLVCIWTYLVVHGARRRWDRYRRGDGYAPDDSLGVMIFFLALIGVTHGMALFATATTWIVPGGHQVPRHGSDWILATMVPVAAATWLGVRRLRQTRNDVVVPLAPMAAFQPPALRQAAIRHWVRVQGGHVATALALAAWAGITSQRPAGHGDPLVYAEPGWVAILLLTGVVLGFHVRAIGRERVGAPSWAWTRWAFGGQLSDHASAQIAAEAVAILADWATAMAASGSRPDADPRTEAWAWLQLLVVSPVQLPASVVRPLLLHPDREIRLRGTQLLGQRACASPPRGRPAPSSPDGA